MTKPNHALKLTSKILLVLAKVDQMKIRENIEKNARQFPNKPVIIFKNEVVTFKQLKENVFKLVNALSRQGIRKGDRVGIYLPNSPEYVYSYLAIFCLGAVGVPLDYMLKNDELIACLEHSEAKCLIVKPRADISLEEIQKSVLSLKTLFLFENFPKILANETPARLDFLPENENDPALIMYTSGTTGKPKGILLNYKHLEGSPKAMEYFVDLNEKDIKLCAIPLSHIGGFIYVQNCINFGITLILMERFNPFEFLENITRHKVTCFHIVPAMYTAMLTLKEIERFDLSSLRWVVVFGAPSSPDILKRFSQYCPNAQLLNGWGMTETCPPNTVTPLSRGQACSPRFPSRLRLAEVDAGEAGLFPTQKIESVGKPSPYCEIKIFDEHNQEVPAGEISEIVIRGPYMMAGYYKDPQNTAEIMRGGWLHTGDLGRFDEEGFLYIAGRKKEMIKVGGQIVYAPEVEAALGKHEAVLEAAVIGSPDTLRGEVVKAFVVLREGHQISSEDLRFFAREHLAHFKVPQTIEIKKELPKNRTGKIDKEILKQEVEVQRNIAAEIKA